MYLTVRLLAWYTSPIPQLYELKPLAIFKASDTLYVNPVGILHIPNTLQTYNLFAYYFFCLLISFYSPTLKFFCTYFTYIIIQPETYLYILQSKFFFKVKSY
jgi:hypothetical protein